MDLKKEFANVDWAKVGKEFVKGMIPAFKVIAEGSENKIDDAMAGIFEKLAEAAKDEPVEVPKA